MKKLYFPIVILLSLLLINLASALVVKSASYSQVTPGQETTLDLEVENTLDDTVSDISLVLDFTNSPFSSVGSSQQSLDELDEDDSEDFTYTIKASSSAKPGDYFIGYELSYTDPDGVTKQKKGSFGITVVGHPELLYTATQENSVINQKGKFTLQITNRGLADAKFVTIRLLPSGYTLLSTDEVYIGTINSDDFQTATFDVIYNELSPTLTAQIEYTDFDNTKLKKTINLPLTVYSKEKALELGIIKKSYVVYYILVIVALIVIWIIIRTIRKRNRMKRSLAARGG